MTMRKRLDLCGRATRTTARRNKRPSHAPQREDSVKSDGCRRVSKASTESENVAICRTLVKESEPRPGIVPGLGLHYRQPAARCTRNDTNWRKSPSWAVR